MSEPSDAQLLEELDALVRSAAEGDARAVGAIAIAFGPMILEEARGALGEDRQDDAADVMQELFAKMMERRLRFPEEPQVGVAIPWMKRMVRVIAEG